MFEYYSDIHVYCPGMGAYGPLGFIFSESLIFRSTAYFLQDFHFKWHFKSFPHSNALMTYVDLAVNRSRSSHAHDLYTHCRI